MTPVLCRRSSGRGDKILDSSLRSEFVNFWTPNNEVAWDLASASRSCHSEPFGGIPCRRGTVLTSFELVARLTGCGLIPALGDVAIGKLEHVLSKNPQSSPRARFAPLWQANSA